MRQGRRKPGGRGSPVVRVCAWKSDSHGGCGAPYRVARPVGKGGVVDHVARRQG